MTIIEPTPTRLERIAEKFGKCIPFLFAGVLFSSAIAFYSFGSFTFEDQRTKQQIYEEEMRQEQVITESLRLQMIQRRKAQKDLAIEKGQAAFKAGENDEITRLNRLIIELKSQIERLENHGFQLDF